MLSIAGKGIGVKYNINQSIATNYKQCSYEFIKSDISSLLIRLYTNPSQSFGLLTRGDFCDVPHVLRQFLMYIHDALT